MAVDYNTNKKVVKKEVSYLGRDFSSVRQNLIEFAKTYFPSQYNDFNESSPGMMFVEMASYVGDVLNYYVDNQFRETLLNYAEEKKNVYNIAQSYGYKPKTAVPAVVDIEVSQLVPAAGDGSPDESYAGVVSSNAIVSSDTGIDFTLLDEVDFRVSSSLDERVDTIDSTDAGNPSYWKLTKKVKAKSGTTTDETFTFTGAKKFDIVKLKNPKVTEVVSITDDDGNTWYEVPFLAQDTVFESIETSELEDPTYSQYQNDTPYMMRLIKTSRRFVTRVTDDGKTELRFGAGVSDNADEEIVPNPDNVGSALGFGVSKLDESFDPSNFMKTKTYGLAPTNTTLNVKYRYGGSIEDNVRSNSITQGKSVVFTIQSAGLDTTKLNTSKNSLTFTNPAPATGGASEETLTEIKQNALAYFNAQNRAVTRQDYLTRIYSLPQKFGNLAKAYIVQDEQINLAEDGTLTTIPNPFAMNMYMLAYDSNKKLTAVNDALKQNIKMYLSQYRMLTDAINLKSAYIINIGVKFAIITQRGYNKNEVLFNCVQAVKNHLDITRWQINQPIVLSDIAYKISLVDGVASVVPPTDNNPNTELILIDNKTSVSSGYSGNVYDIASATKKGVLYPSLDPSIFEVKYPNQDILGKVVGDI
jgi:hypothetical protein